MLKFHGQTGKTLVIQLPSSIVSAKWGLDHAAQGGTVTIEVNTCYVATGSDITIKIKELDETVIDTISGNVMSNLFRVRYRLKKLIKSGGLTFDVEMPAHKLKAKGGLLKVAKVIEFFDLKFLKFDESAPIKEIRDDLPAAASTRVRGLADGEKVRFQVFLRTNLLQAEGNCFVSTEVAVVGGKAVLFFGPKIHNGLEKLKVQMDLDKEGGKYFQPEYLFAVSADGVQKLSESAKMVQNVKLHIWEFPDAAGMFEGMKVKVIHPDGKTEVKTVPQDGTIELKKALPGKHSVQVVEGHGGKGKEYNSKTKITTSSDDSKNPENSKSTAPEKIEMRFPLDAEIRKLINKNYHSGGKIFGYKRTKSSGGHRSHAGCDLVCDAGTPIYAVADGKLRRYDNFYMGTFYIEVDHFTFTARYGEVQPDYNMIPAKWHFIPPKEVCKGLGPGLKVGSLVKRGDLIGWVGELRELDKHTKQQKVVNHMLHFEMYKDGFGDNLTVVNNSGFIYVPESPYERRKDLLNPTKYLDEAADA